MTAPKKPTTRKKRAKVDPKLAVELVEAMQELFELGYELVITPPKARKAKEP